MTYKNTLVLIFAFLGGVTLLSPSPAQADWLSALRGNNYHHNNKRIKEKQKDVRKAEQELQKKRRELRKEVRKSYSGRSGNRRHYVGGAVYGSALPRGYYGDKRYRNNISPRPRHSPRHYPRYSVRR